MTKETKDKCPICKTRIIRYQNQDWCACYEKYKLAFVGSEIEKLSTQTQKELVELWKEEKE